MFPIPESEAAAAEAGESVLRSIIKDEDAKPTVVEGVVLCCGGLFCY